MPSIILSFVGNQDPASEQTNEPGSIVTLTHHLLEQNNSISCIILLYTQGTKEAAILTQEWLLSDELPQLEIAEENIDLIPVNGKLSQDPVDLLLAIKSARQALEKAKSYLNQEDFLELNASSGTPVMKSAWNILQAAGYAPQSRVWQVRNPDKITPGQSRVFEANVDTLKREFDIKIIKQQIEQYDYNGALITFESSHLTDNGISNLLKCGSYRLASAFDISFNQIKNYSNIIDEQLYAQAKGLAARQHREIIKEIYFQSAIKAKNQEYSELLVKIFVFQESVLFYLLKQKLLPQQYINSVMNEDLSEKLDFVIANYQNGQLQQYLQQYRLKNDRKLVLTSGYNRTVMTTIVEYFHDKNTDICPLLQTLDSYCHQRNDYVHQLKGISNLESNKIMSTMKQILKILEINIKPNPFDVINQKIYELLNVQ